jgi:hypothetical protein
MHVFGAVVVAVTVVAAIVDAVINIILTHRSLYSLSAASDTF